MFCFWDELTCALVRCKPGDTYRYIDIIAASVMVVIMMRVKYWWQDVITNTKHNFERTLQQFCSLLLFFSPFELFVQHDNNLHVGPSMLTVNVLSLNPNDILSSIQTIIAVVNSLKNIFDSHPNPVLNTIPYYSCPIISELQKTYHWYLSYFCSCV